MAVTQWVFLAVLVLQSCWAAPAYPGAYNGGAYNAAGFYNGAYNNGAYNGAYNRGYYNGGAYNGGAYNGGAYNGAYDGATFDPYPRYNFDYRVAEPRTGDFKNHQESRNGDAVRGSYSVAEPDGSLLTVRYAADDANGYTAVVERSGHGGTVVQSFPGPAPLPVGAVGAVAPGYVAPVAPVAPIAPVAAALHHGAAAVPFAAPVGSAYGPGGPGGLPRPVGAAYPYHGGYGTSSTSFHGPHAAYSYTN